MGVERSKAHSCTSTYLDSHSSLGHSSLLHSPHSQGRIGPSACQATKSHQRSEALYSQGLGLDPALLWFLTDHAHSFRVSMNTVTGEKLGRP